MGIPQMSETKVALIASLNRKLALPMQNGHASGSVVHGNIHGEADLEAVARPNMGATSGASRSVLWFSTTKSGPFEDLLSAG